MIIKKPAKAQLKSFRPKQQGDFIGLLGDLLVNGFTLQESLVFMAKILPKQGEVFQLLGEELSRGTLFYKCMALTGLAPLYVAQLRLAEVHGDLSGTLAGISQQIKQKNKQQMELIKIVSYPVMLIVFLFIAIFLIRQIMLPQIQSHFSQANQLSLGLGVIMYGPPVFLWLLVSSSLVVIVLRLYFKNKSALKQSLFLGKVPLLRFYYKYYQTAFFAHEWGKLLNQGLEMKEILEVMQSSGSTLLMKEIAEHLMRALSRGEPVYYQISRWAFFRAELSLIIQQGEAKGKLGDELIIYSQRLNEQLSLQMSQVLNWVQPCVFLLVAGLIILLYTGLLLPIYRGMEDFL